MNVIDALALPLAVVLPLVGLLFVVAMPGSDRITLRHVGMGASIAAGLLLLRAFAVGASPVLLLDAVDVELTLSVSRERLAAGIAVAFTTPVALRAGAPRAALRAKAYTSLVLLTEAALFVALLSTSAIVSLVALSLTAPTMMFLIALFGGPHKGTVALKRVVAVLAADAVALGALILPAESIPEPLYALALVLPLVVRAGVFPLGSIVSDVIEQSSVTVIALERAAVLPVAATWWVLHHGEALPPVVGQMALVAVLLGVALSVCNVLVERDLRRFVGDAALVADGAPLLALLLVGQGAWQLALPALALMGGATASLAFTIDAMERRFSTRDSVELVGTGDQLPGLFRIFALAAVTALPVPGLGAGALLPAVVIEATRGTSALMTALGRPASTGLFVGGGLLLAIALVGVSASVHLRRVVSPARGPMRTPPPFGFGHAARLWFPAILLVVLGVLASRAMPTPSPSGSTSGGDLTGAGAHDDVTPPVDAPPVTVPEVEEGA
jgi:NADH:ubiquinone oxidoreductase subunit 4 (subunit M)